MAGQGALAARKVGAPAAGNPGVDADPLDGVDPVDECAGVNGLISLQSVDLLLVIVADLSLAEMSANMGHPIPSKEKPAGLAAQKSINMIVA